MMPYPELGTITDEERAAVTRMMSREPDGDVLLDMLIGELSPAVGRGTTDKDRNSRKHGQVLTAAERARIRDLRRQGMTQVAIAAEIGRSRDTVVRALAS